jgi:hypothetical protein
MYNRYLPRDDAYEPIPPEEPPRTGREERRPPPPKGPQAGPGGALGGLLKGLRLEKLDRGDLLLALILLLLLMDSDDDLERILTLGLILFGLFGKEDEPEP